MKTTKLLMMGFVLYGAMLMSGCGDSPSDVTKGLFKSLAAKDVKGIEKYSDGKDFKMLLILSDEELKEFDKVEVISEEINGDTAQVIIKDTDDNTFSVMCVKVDGKWKLKSPF